MDMGLGEKIIQSIGQVAGKEVNNATLTNKGILMLVLNEDKVLVKGRAASGMKAMGTEKVVSKSDESWIIEIDNQPAADLVMKYMGESLTEEDFRDFNMKYIFLKLMREDGSSIIRTTFGFDMDTKGVTVTGSIKKEKT